MAPLVTLDRTGEHNTLTASCAVADSPEFEDTVSVAVEDRFLMGDEKSLDLSERPSEERSASKLLKV